MRWFHKAIVKQYIKVAKSKDENTVDGEQDDFQDGEDGGEGDFVNVGKVEWLISSCLGILLYD